MPVAPVAAAAVPKTRHPAGGSRPAAAGGRRGDGDDGAGRAARPKAPGERTRPAFGRHAGPTGGRVGAPERARPATADRAPRGGCGALRVGRLLPLVLE